MCVCVGGGVTVCDGVHVCVSGGGGGEGYSLSATKALLLQE